MKKIFSLFAAVLFAGSMMAAEPIVLTFSDWGDTSAKSATDDTPKNQSGDSSTKLTIQSLTDSLKGSADFVTCSEATQAYPARVGYGCKMGSSSNAGTFTLNLETPAEFDSIVVYCASYGTNEGSLTINGGEVFDLTDGGASNKVLRNVTYVPTSEVSSLTIATTAKRAFVKSITFYPKEEGAPEGTPAKLYEFTTGTIQGSNNSYAGNCDIEVNDITWNFSGNSQMNPWRIGGKSLDAVERTVYTKTAFTSALDSIILHLGDCSLTSLDGVKLVYSTNADFSEASEIAAVVPAEFPASITFTATNGFPANAYYKFVFTCTVSATSNKFVQFVGVEFWGLEVPVAVEKPSFDVAAGSYYDEQTIHLTSETEGAVFYYTTDGTEPTSASTLYMPTYGIYLAAGTTTTIKAIAYNNDSDNPQYSEVVEKTYTIATHYASLDDLVTEAGTPADQKVVVTLTNVVIDSLYANKSGNINGVYVTAADRMVEIYCYNVPSEWEVGGTISGVLKGEWKNYNGTWEVCPANWNGITYQAASTLTFNVVPDVQTFTVTPSDLTAEYYIEVNEAGFTADFITAYIDAMIDEMGEGLEYFSGVQTQSYADDWYTDEPGDYVIIVCGINAEHNARTTDVIITPFTISTSTTTSLQNVEAVKATKALVNGQVVIFRGDKRFNLVGAKF